MSISRARRSAWVLPVLINAAVYLLVRPGARSFAVALLVSLAGVAAVLAYRYVDVLAIESAPAAVPRQMIRVSG